MARSQREITNEAQRLLIEEKVTLGQLAAVCECSRQACSKWMNGAGIPDDERKKSIAKRWKDIRPALWKQKPKVQQKSPSGVDFPPPEPDGSGDVSGREAAQEHMTLVRKLRKAAQTKQSSDLFRYLELERKAIIDFSKFSGELTAAEESRLTETKRWREVRSRILEVLSAHPDAARDVVAALKELSA